MEKREGIVLLDGKVFKMDFPVQTNANIIAWTLDFLRALEERPRIIRVSLRWIFGKWAYREFIGLIQGMIDNGWSPMFGYIGYGLENLDYQKDEIQVEWWKIE